MTRILYRQYKERCWIKQVFEDKCDCEVDIFGGRCQGAKGHKGHHWYYSEAGWLVERPSEEERRKDQCNWGIRKTPPDHKNYVSPKEKQSEHYLSFSEYHEIEDEDLIDKLEADEYIGENVSIDRIVTEKEMDQPFGEEGKSLRKIIEERSGS